jgi:hypothetical protein
VSSRPRARLALAAAFLGGLALVLPTLGMGFYADDYVHQLVLSGELDHHRLRPWSLYDFGTATDWQGLSGSSGGMPWWMTPEWKTRFWRPLTSASLWLDHALFGSDPLGYHLTSLALYALVLCLAFATWRALGLRPGVATAALALFAATNAAGLVAGWIAHRNTLLSCAATLGVLLVLARGRGSARSLAVASLLAALACTAKESGVMAWLLFAGWLWLDPSPRPGIRRAGILLALACALLFVVGLAVAGYGTRSAFYASPWGDPLRYAGHLGLLATAGLLRLALPLSADFTVFAPDFALAQVVLAAVLLAVLLPWIARRTRGEPGRGVLLLWLALSLALQGAAPPSDRLLFDAAFASAALLALHLARCLSASSGAGRGERAAALTLLVMAGPLSALAGLGQNLTQARISRELRESVLSTEVGSPSEGRRELVVLQASSGMLAFVLPATWAVESPDRELWFHLVQLGRRGLECTRHDERSLLVRSTGEPFLTGVFERVYRPGLELPPAGARFQGRIFEVEVVESGARGPQALMLRFDRSLDAPELHLLADRDGRLARVPTPSVGGSLRLEEARPPLPFLP